MQFYFIFRNVWELSVFSVFSSETLWGWDGIWVSRRVVNATRRQLPQPWPLRKGEKRKKSRFNLLNRFPRATYDEPVCTHMDDRDVTRLAAVECSGIDAHSGLKDEWHVGTIRYRLIDIFQPSFYDDEELKATGNRFEARRRRRWAEPNGAISSLIRALLVSRKSVFLCSSFVTHAGLLCRDAEFLDPRRYRSQPSREAHY